MRAPSGSKKAALARLDALVGVPASSTFRVCLGRLAAASLDELCDRIEAKVAAEVARAAQRFTPTPK